MHSRSDQKMWIVYKVLIIILNDVPLWRSDLVDLTRDKEAKTRDMSVIYIFRASIDFPSSPGCLYTSYYACKDNL
jgi:hypothetical protein